MAGSLMDTELHFQSDVSKVEVGHGHRLLLLKMSELDLVRSEMDLDINSQTYCQFLEDMHPSTPLCSCSANAFDGRIMTPPPPPDLNLTCLFVHFQSFFCHWMEINRSDGKTKIFFNCVGYGTSHSFKLLRERKHFAKEDLHSCWDLHKETAAQMLH